MGIMIKEIKLEDINITKDKETGVLKVEGDYSLMSVTDTVLAKQGFNGYNEIKVELTKEAREALNKFYSGLKESIQAILGLTEEK
ncbi:MAG TPA: hypothetical protein ENH41_03400 [Candidatus Omnitrophica bacterium]|nr:hypothetical protein [Candidatus Omnitrophota bacterium]